MSIEWDNAYISPIIVIIYSTIYISMLERTRSPVLDNSSSSGRYLFGVYYKFRLGSQIPSLLIYRLLAQSPGIACDLSLALDLIHSKGPIESCLQVKPVERVPYRFGPNPIVSKTFPPREKRQKMRLSNMTHEP
jgi:hypothetical protein